MSDSDETLALYLNPEEAKRRHGFLRRHPVVRRGLTAAVLAGTAAILVGLFGQGPALPEVRATLPEKPAEAPESASDGFSLDSEVLAPAASAAGRTGQMRALQSGQSGMIPAPSKVPVQQPVPPPAGPTVPKAGTPVKAEPEVEFEDETRPPVETNTQDPPAEDQQPELSEEVCWEGWTYDDDRQECVRDEDLVPPEKNEDPGSEEGEPVTDDGGGDEHGAAVPGGIGKGTGWVQERR